MDCSHSLQKFQFRPGPILNLSWSEGASANLSSVESARSHSIEKEPNMQRPIHLRQHKLDGADEQHRLNLNHHQQHLDPRYKAFTVGEAQFDYTLDMPHDGWHELLPFTIDLYKTGVATVRQEKLVAWYSVTPKDGN
ncbi:hypothetical protein VTI74DRAFT_3517 [Chaetomium olivicolor]